MSGDVDATGTDGPGRGGRVARAALVVAVATALSKLAGFGRDAVIAGVYGASPELDAWYVAQGVPNLAVGLVGSATATALVPTLSRHVDAGRVADAHRLALGVLVVVSVLVAVVSAGLAVAAGPVVGLTAPGFTDSQHDLAVDLARVLLVAAVLVAAVNVLTAVLQAHGRFLVANLVGLPFNAALVVAAVVLGSDEGVAALAIGFLAGSVLRVAVLVPDLRRAGAWSPAGVLSGPARAEARSVLVLALPLLGASALSNVNSIVDRIVGSSEEPGTISALNLAYRLLTIPHSLVVLALGQAALPALSTADDDSFDHMVRRGVTMLWLVLAPVATLAVALAGPLVAAVFARGSFDAASASLAQRAVVGYAVGVAALGVREFLVRCHVALAGTRVALLVVGLGVAVNVAGDLTLGRRYGVAGLAASTSLSFAAALVLAAALLVRRRPTLDLAPFVRPLLVTTGAAAAGGLAAWVTATTVLGDATAVEAGTVRTFAALVAGGGVGLGLYATATRAGAPALWRDGVATVRAAVRRRR